MTPYQTQKAEAVRHAKSEASQPKSRLIDLAGRMRSAGAGAEATRLDRIIARLEAWQNT